MKKKLKVVVVGENSKSFTVQVQERRTVGDKQKVLGTKSFTVKVKKDISINKFVEYLKKLLR